MMNQEVFKEYIPRAMDNQSGVLMNIVNNAIKGAFSDFTQQQGYVAPYCQQPRLSANTTAPACYHGILNQAALVPSTTSPLVDTSVHPANNQAPVSASQPMMHQQQRDVFMVAHQLMVQQPPPITQQSWLGGLQPQMLDQQSWPGGLQFSQLATWPQPSGSHWSQELALQQEALSPQQITHQPHQPITLQSMISLFVIEKSKEMAHLMESDGDLCPTDMVKVG
jgi:hypothetical protein